MAHKKLHMSSGKKLRRTPYVPEAAEDFEEGMQVWRKSPIVELDAHASPSPIESKADMERWMDAFDPQDCDYSFVQLLSWDPCWS